MACLEPPLVRLPRGQWLCPECKDCSHGEGIVLDDAEFPCLESGSDNDVTPVPPTPGSATRGSVRIRKPIVRFNPVNTIIADVHNYEPDPVTIEEAFSGEHADEWMAATISELSSLLEKGTFEIVDLTDDISPIQCKWVFKSKIDAFGFLTKRKARLVCKGFQQKYGVDYDEVFSPVSGQSTLRVILAYAAANDLEIDQMDINVAFLNAELNETVYVDIPPGLKDKYPGKTMKLNKCLYGLKQSPREWWLNISTFLSKHGFTPSMSDPCLLIKNGKQGLVLTLIYVDDILIIGSRVDVDEAVALINGKYAATYMGEVKSFLNQAISRDRSNHTITLSQPQFVKDLAQKFNFDMDHKKPVSIPIRADYRHDKDKKPEQPLPADNNFASLIGSLLYLANCTRPDISFAVSALSRHLSSPLPSHMGMAKQVLRYVINTDDYGLTFGPSTSTADNSVELVGYSDSDYGSDFLHSPGTITRRSVTGFVFLINGTPVAWQSRKQQTVSRSTDEAEYQAMAAAASMGLWLRKQLAEIEPPAIKLQMFADNQAAIAHVHNPGSLRKTKHVDITHQFVLDRLTRGDLDFTYVPSSENIADIFTKGLVKETFEKLRNKMGVCKITKKV